MGIRIASFNIEKFGDNSVEFRNGTYSRKDLTAIAKIISSNNVDILAIQEITHPDALVQLMRNLSQTKVDLIRMHNEGQTAEMYACKSSTWEGRWAKPRSIYSDKAAEGYAFLWNTKTIQLVENYNKKLFEPRIGYRIKKHALVRAPFVGRFKPVQGYYEIRIINTHIAWDAPKGVKNEEDIDLMTRDRLKELRIKELKTLLDQVYVNFENKHSAVDGYDRSPKPMQAYTFLLGDYNLNLPGMGQGAEMPLELAKKEYPDFNMRLITVNEELTTLKDLPQKLEKLEQLRCERDDNQHLANNYDHFSYDQRKYVSHGIADPLVSVIPAYKNYKDITYENATGDYQAKFDLYKQKISDHLPIILDIDVREKRK